MTSDTSLVKQVERLRVLGVTPKVRKSKKRAASVAVIPNHWLDGTSANGDSLQLAASEDEIEADEEEESEGDAVGAEIGDEI